MRSWTIDNSVTSRLRDFNSRLWCSSQWIRLLIITLLAQCSLPAWPAASIHVIGNPVTKDLHPDVTMLVNIFKRKMRVDKEGKTLIPVNLPVDHPLRSVFSMTLFGQQPEAMERYWNEQYFKGISPPFVLSSMEAIRRFVASTPGAIGYVMDCQSKEGVEMLLDIALSSDQQRKLAGLCEAEAARPGQP